MSAGRYKDLSEYMKTNNGKVRGFDGEVWYDWIVIDIDELVPEKVLLFIQHLEVNYEIPQDCLRLYFSGSKGFHILIPSILFGLKPSKTLHHEVKAIVKVLADGIIDYDTSLYDKTQIYRLQHTLHAKGNRYKIPISGQELKNLNEIKAKALKPRKDWINNPYPDESIDKLVEITNKISTEIQNPSAPSSLKSGEYLNREHASRIPDRSKLCIYSILDGISKGERDSSAVRIAVHFKNQGFSMEIVNGIVLGWNQLNKPPMNDAHLSNIVISAFKSEYEYGCHDEVLDAHCDPNCYLFNKG